MVNGDWQSWGSRAKVVRVVGAAIVLDLFIVSLMLSRATALILNSTSRGCSKHCESINCDNPHSIRYGKFCGVGYTGCLNQSPCDRLDLCCKQHDVCVGTNAVNFSNHTCRGNLKSCVQQYLNTGAPVFHGSNCSAMIVQNTIMIALDGTTYHLAPGRAPLAGHAASNLVLPNWIFLVSSLGSAYLWTGVTTQNLAILS